MWVGLCGRESQLLGLRFVTGGLTKGRKGEVASWMFWKEWRESEGEENTEDTISLVWLISLGFKLREVLGVAG